ncbi:O-methyltransferase [Peribacillus sp. SCS-26]|uniref:O-methyltransferase n=1 Tax=Paraperibacillus marinus TaxID=3115295 RepID=UPI00390618A1
MDEKVEEYLQSLIPEPAPLFAEMEKYAEDNGVPIMEKAGMEALLQFLRLHGSKRILEVGTAIGYSALRMSDALPEARIVTLERDEERISLAREYITRAANPQAVKIIAGDALDTYAEAEAEGPFDTVFIDAAKGQYRKFFELYEPLLDKGGLIVTDNVLFKGLVAANIKEIEQKRIRSLVRKIKDFNEWLMNHASYDTVILPIGDGVAISKRK